MYKEKCFFSIFLHLIGTGQFQSNFTSSHTPWIKDTLEKKYHMIWVTRTYHKDD